MVRPEPVIELELAPYRNDLAARWRVALEREGELRNQNIALVKSQLARSTEFEHRLFNGLQMIVSLLLLQCRTAEPTAAEQLNAAAMRISAFARVHRRLHLIDCDDTVEIKQHLQDLCTDLAGLLFADQVKRTIVVESEKCELPATLAVPISLIVNELITNSVKHAKTNITVRFESITPVSRSLSVVDEGPGMPGGFDPAKSTGLGMQIVQALVKEIGGELRLLTGTNGRGTMVTLTFFLSNREKA